MRFRRSLTYMPEATASVPPDSDPPASFTLDSADSKCQPAQIVRHISLTQLEALHAVPLDNSTRETLDADG
jgi:hypothetical protein